MMLRKRFALFEIQIREKWVDRRDSRSGEVKNVYP